MLLKILKYFKQHISIISYENLLFFETLLSKYYILIE